MSFEYLESQLDNPILRTLLQREQEKEKAYQGEENVVGNRALLLATDLRNLIFLSIPVDMNTFNIKY